MEKLFQKLNYKKKNLKNNDKLEIVPFYRWRINEKDIFKVAGKFLKSRLIVGTGKYKSFN